MTDLPELADLLEYEERAAAWLQAHVEPGADACCKACGVQYLRGELSPDGLCRHCADELNAFIDNRLPLGTPVTLYTGVDGVIVRRSTCSSGRYLVTWFDRHFWVVQRKWYDRRAFTVGELVHTGAASSAAIEKATLSA